MPTKEWKLRSKIGCSNYLPGMHYLEIPAAMVKKMGGTFRLRLLCTVNKKVTFSCGLLALGEGKGFIMFSKPRMKLLGVKLGDKVHLVLKKDESKFGMELSEELAEVLKQDPECGRRFEALSPGKQRNIIHFTNSIKNSDKRIDRSLSILENLKLLPEGNEPIPKILGLKQSRDR